MSVYKYILLVSLCLCSCSKDIIDTTGNLIGTVRDSRTGNLLDGASVTLSQVGKTTTTGTDGRYAFQNVESQGYTVQVVKSGYQSDSKSIFVTAGEDNTLDFSITPSVGVLTVNQTSLDFGNETTTQTFNIKNTGNAPLTWSVSEDASWLSCSPVSGTTQEGETSAVVVNVNREGLERGNYSQTIAVASNGGSEVLRVNMLVQGISISIAPEELDFGSVTTSIPFTMTNNGSGSISYSLTPSNSWIKTSKSTGVFTSSENVTVSVDRSTFSPGDYSGSIKLVVAEQEIIVPVRMNIPNKEKPTVSMYSADNITYNGAIFRGGVVSVGSAQILRHGFCWNTAGEPTLDNAESCNLGDCSSAKDFTYNVSGLTANTIYYVRSYAENAEGISFSNAVKFQTSGTPQKPEVETGTISGVQTNQATVTGNIVKLGNVESISQYGHVWSVNPHPTINNGKTELGSTTSTGAYTSTITGLNPNTTYHVRAYAVNKIGIAYGEDASFTTPLGHVVLKTDGVDNITYNSAVVCVTVATTGGHTVTERGVCWSLSPTPTIVNEVKSAAVSGNAFSVTLSKLRENTKYYVRSYAKTQTGQTYYGNEISFTTSEKDININKNGYETENNWNR